MEILNEWLNDLPQQFQSKKNIEILISAFAKQMYEIQKVYRQLDLQTDLDSAVGINLDMVGDIAVLTRKEAHNVLRTAQDIKINDDIYRKVLLWKLIKNTCDCTYTDIMKSMSLLWNTDNVSYVEDPLRPATIYIKMPTINTDEMDPIVGRILSIKPAGVALIYALGYLIEVNISGIEKVILLSVLLHITLCNTYNQSISKIMFGIVKVLCEEDSIVVLKFVIQQFIVEILGNNYITMLTSILFKKYVSNVYNISLNYEMAEDYEKFMVSAVFKKNVWYLDGSYTLNGDRYLDGKITEEVLEDV